MDVLDKLKNDWNKNVNYPRFSQQQIYAMLHKRSSSIVKWILIISVAEFAAWIILSFLLQDNSTSQKLKSLNMEFLLIGMTAASYGIIIYFIYIFYLRYKKITTTDNVSTLMSNILQTRKAVKAYIYINIGYNIIGALVILFIILKADPNLSNAYQQSQEAGNEALFYFFAIVISLLILGLFFFGMWLLYRLIYGILLKRLYNNYQELKKLDI